MSDIIITARELADGSGEFAVCYDLNVVGDTLKEEQITLWGTGPDGSISLQTLIEAAGDMKR